MFSNPLQTPIDLFAKCRHLQLHDLFRLLSPGHGVSLLLLDASQIFVRPAAAVERDGYVL
jgi:hypothetical protein